MIWCLVSVAAKATFFSAFSSSEAAFTFSSSEEQAARQNVRAANDHILNLNSLFIPYIYYINKVYALEIEDGAEAHHEAAGLDVAIICNLLEVVVLAHADRKGRIGKDIEALDGCPHEFCAH